jgi:hypothetical protein
MPRHFGGNPVEAGIVEKPEHYLYNSAMDYVLRTKCGLLDVTFKREGVSS